MYTLTKILDDIIYGKDSFNDKMAALRDIEPYIEQQYALGKTTIKPVSMLTVDDLLSL